MRVFLYALACGLTVAALAGCSGKMVSVVDEAGFQSMARHFGPALQSQQILDSDGAWLEPLVSVFDGVPDDAGERLFRHLSPAFRFREADATSAPATFVASRAEGDELTVLSHGFALVQGMRQVSVSLLGLSDWNGDGTDDWFVRCSVRALQSARGEDERDYYLVITDPEAAIMRPQVIGVFDCRNRRCVAYANGRDCPPESAVVELLAGQRTVTVPPAKAGGQGEPDLLQEQKLKN